MDHPLYYDSQTIISFSSCQQQKLELNIAGPKRDSQILSFYRFAGVTKIFVRSYIQRKTHNSVIGYNREWEMDIITHKMIDKELCGRPLLIDDNYSKVEMKTSQRMAVDVTGLVHGGFVFGLADYSAMIAVNHPNVVLGAAEVKFLKPVKSGDVLVAEARAGEKEGKRQSVAVVVKNGDTEVFKGMFICFTLDKHVLIN
jgi:uncharacterized protein (TIGR00369 family)